MPPMSEPVALKPPPEVWEQPGRAHLSAKRSATALASLNTINGSPSGAITGDGRPTSPPVRVNTVLVGPAEHEALPHLFTTKLRLPASEATIIGSPSGPIATDVL